MKKTKLEKNWLAKRVIKLQGKYKEKRAARANKKKKGGASREEFESLIEMQCRKRSVSIVREAKEHVMKQHWIIYRDFGVVVVEGGLRK